MSDRDRRQQPPRKTLACAGRGLAVTAPASAEVPESGSGGVSSDALLARAAAGDAEAWELLVDRHTGLLWATARGHGLSAADAADTVLTTWSLLAQQLDSIRDPNRVGTWLATTARRESVRRLAGRRPAHPHLEVASSDSTDRADAAALGATTRAALLRALRLLPPHQQLLLHVLSAEPRPTTDQVGAALNMPIGEIESARTHALHRLRQLLGPAGVRR
jgi:RNA polymerase sigma factor (sigma-70 family)